MAGLINQEINQEDPLGSVQGIDPERIEVDAATDTVQGQIEGIVAKDSPLMQQAKTTALQGMNSRGLLNSSMAVGAGQTAVYGAALPIAQQDASTYFTAKSQNQAAGNRALEFNAGSANAAASQLGAQQAATALEEQKAQISERLLVAEGVEKAKLIEQQAEVDTALQELRGEQSMELQKKIGKQNKKLQILQGDQAVELANIEAQYKNQIQASASAAQIFSTAQIAMSEILANPDIPVEQKQELIDKELNLLENGMAVVGGASNVDLSNLLDFSAMSEGTTGGTTSGGGTTGGTTYNPYQIGPSADPNAGFGGLGTPRGG